jgi:segregation and condensation protein B
MADKDKSEQAQGRLPLPAREPPPAQSLAANVSRLPSADRWEKLRILEAVLFAAKAPMEEAGLVEYFTGKDDIGALLEELQNLYAGRGVNLARVAGKWAFRTAPDLSFILERHSVEPRRLSRAALETLAIIAYHQPVTRAEIEEIRGVTTSKGTLDVLLEMGWIRLRGRRRAPGRPVTYGTTEIFLEHFGFDSVKDLPGLGELKGAGLLDSNLPPGFSIPEPNDSVLLTPDEDPLDGDDAEEVEDPPSDAEPPLTEEEPPEEDREPLQFSPQVFSLLRQGQA